MDWLDGIDYKIIIGFLFLGYHFHQALHMNIKLMLLIFRSKIKKSQFKCKVFSKLLLFSFDFTTTFSLLALLKLNQKNNKSREQRLLIIIEGKTS